jgi:transposase-like protein
MLHRIRLALKSGTFEKMGGTGSAGVEADETFVGGRGYNRHAGKKPRGRGPVGKAIVMGLLERHSEKKKKQVRASVIPVCDAMSIQGVIHKNVEYGSNVFSDALHAYRGLDDFFEHQIIDHAERYVDGIVHTNGLENFWSLLKRCIKGTHVSIDPVHLGAYIDSEAFRFNNRDTNDRGRFLLALQGVSGKRLTYKSLTGAMSLEERSLSGNNGASASDA